MLGTANLGFLTSLATGTDDIIEKFLNNYTFLTLSKKKLKYGKSLQYSFKKISLSHEDCLTVANISSGKVCEASGFCILI